jgi:PAS domain S-box-containing protein
MESNTSDSGTLYEAIVEQAPDAVIFADRDGAIRVWNRGAEAIFGYAAPEVLGASLDVIIPEPLRKAHWQGFDRALESGTMKYAGRVLTTRSMHKDGRRLYVDLSFSLVKDAVGTIVGALAMARDCTERYLAEKARASGSASAAGPTGRT